VFTDTSPHGCKCAKSKGSIYAGIQLDGQVVIEGDNENEGSYGRRVKAAELIMVATGVRRLGSADVLIVMIEIAEGKGTRENMIRTRPAPSQPPGTITEPPSQSRGLRSRS
jgi:hypothetical protein